jgi:hypothetical protein
MNTRSKAITGIGSLVLIAATAATGMAGSTATAAGQHTRHLHAKLLPLNNSGAHGNADVIFHRHRPHQAHVDIDAYRLAKGLPHAQHIHFGATARHECPSVKDDKNGDFRLSTAEGLPAYGGIVKSLTTRGDTTPKSALAVDRFPTTPRGIERYYRTMYFADNAVRNAIKRGDAVVVIHGVDYNNNGKYDKASAGASELDPKLPAEATDPALCGVLRVKHHR